MEQLSEEIKRVVPNYRTRFTSVAVAGPISGEQVVLTNWEGPPAARTVNLSEFPVAVFPRGKSRLLNDLAAGAYGLAAADKQGILGQYFEQLFRDRAPLGPILGVRTAVLAMGSGLGVALITWGKEGARVLATEGGHLQIPIRLSKHPAYAEESSLLEKVSAHWYGQAKLMPEYEDIASGRGLKLVYSLLSGQPLAQCNVPQIIEKAREGDKVARKAFLWNNVILMRAAKAVATSMNCDSVVLALDNQARNYDLVKSIESELAEEFYEFIRPDWMSKVRVYTQKKVLNFNLLGTTHVATRGAAQE
jgi:glucokinase